MTNHGLQLPIPSGGKVDFWKIPNPNRLTNKGEKLEILPISLNCEEVDSKGRRTPCVIYLSRMRCGHLGRIRAYKLDDGLMRAETWEKESVTTNSTSRTSVFAHLTECEDLAVANITSTGKMPQPHPSVRAQDQSPPSHEMAWPRSRLPVAETNPHVLVHSSPPEHVATSGLDNAGGPYAMQELWQATRSAQPLTTQFMRREYAGNVVGPAGAMAREEPFLQTSFPEPMTSKTLADSMEGRRPRSPRRPAGLAVPRTHIRSKSTGEYERAPFGGFGYAGGGAERPMWYDQY